MLRCHTKRLVAVALCHGLLACSLTDIVGKSPNTTDIATPDAVQSVTGVADFNRGVIEQLAAITATYTRLSGLMTDELRTSSNVTGRMDPIDLDIRILQEDEMSYKADNGFFANLSLLRVHAREARRVINEYAPALAGVYLGHMFAIEGMAHLMLADMYCSGVPLSTLDSKGMYVFSKAISTPNVYRAAIELFDSAIAHTQDSVRILQFAKTGKARALLALGQYQAAGVLAGEVTDPEFQYAMQYKNRPNNTKGNGFIRTNDSYAWFGVTVGDNEGINGLPYVTSNDPRSAVLSGFALPTSVAPLPYPRYVAKKYDDINGNDSIVIASMIEMRLIAAEYALQSNNIPQWLSILNALRTSCTSEALCVDPAPAGLGKVSGLSLLHDPAIDSLPEGKTVEDVRVDLMFRERAFWLFLTGHRQGDLRRLVRNYGRTQDKVYPTGGYAFTQLGGPTVYGIDVNMPIPEGNNPEFTGCIDRGA